MIIAHRGASGYRPEHTRAAYELAYRMGAEWVDVDLVVSADGHLIARHENELGHTTDVAQHPEFADRRTSKTVTGKKYTGWFTEDFTLAELKTLRATERLPRLRQANTLYDGRYELLTLREVLDIVGRLETELNRELGISPEVKHAAYFTEIGLPIEPRLVAALRERELASAGAPVVIQAFEQQSLRALQPQLDVPLLQLTQHEYPDTAEIAQYADYVGAEKRLVIDRDKHDKLGEPSQLVTDAHRAGLQVLVWTFRNENTFLPAELRTGRNDADVGNVFAEYAAYRAAGADGFVSDHPDTALEATSTP